MDRKLLAKLGAEVDLIIRLRTVAPDEVVRRIIEFLDYEFHGIVPLPLDGVQVSPKGED